MKSIEITTMTMIIIATVLVSVILLVPSLQQAYASSLTIKGVITSKPQPWNGIGSTVKGSIENGTLVDSSTPDTKYNVYGTIIMTIRKISFDGILVKKIDKDNETYQDLSFTLPVRAGIAKHDLGNGSKTVVLSLGGTERYPRSQSLLTIDGFSTDKVLGKWSGSYIVILADWS